MIKLMKNEFKKILKKKGTYIILAITLAMIILTNVIYKITENLSGNNLSDSMISYYEEELKNLNPNDASSKSTYIDYKTEYDLLKLSEKYGFDSWQANLIPEQLRNDVYAMNSYSKDEETYKSAKSHYDSIVEKLDTDDWKYFVNSSLSDVNNQIESLTKEKEDTIDKSEINSINENLYNLEIQKQVLEWRLEKDISYATSFFNSCLNSYKNYAVDVYSYEHSDNHDYSEKQQYYSSLSNMNEYKYYIENNINSIKEHDNRSILLNDVFTEYELFILIFVVMVAGTMISEEFNKGTIKLLLIRPYSRVKILLAKFLVCVISLILFIAIVVGLQFIVGGIVHGFDSTSIPAVVYNFDTNQIQTMNVFKYVFIQAIAKMPMYLLLLTLSFSCSTILVNTPLAIIIPLLGYMGFGIINILATTYKLKFLTFFVTLNWDFTQYLFGHLPDYEGLTIPFSLIICLIYFMIMIITSVVIFKKKNIKNI